jgi:glycosyltransferase involved in cell wall biosynthesis
MSEARTFTASGAKEKSLVSVILPTYNRRDLIGRSIRSVLAQTYRNFELLVVDDGSTDATDSVVKSFTDARVKYLRIAGNKGPGFARNLGIEASTGSLVAFQDSDDEWAPQKLESHVTAFEAGLPSTGVVYSDMLRVHERGDVRYHDSPKIVRGRLLNPLTHFYQVHYLGVQSSVIRRKCLDAVGGFNVRLPCFEDLDLFIRLSDHCDFVHIREPLVKYYETDGICKDKQAQYAGRKILFELYSNDPRCDATFLRRERWYLTTSRYSELRRQNHGGFVRVVGWIRYRWARLRGARLQGSRWQRDEPRP